MWLTYARESRRFQIYCDLRSLFSRSVRAPVAFWVRSAAPGLVRRVDALWLQANALFAPRCCANAAICSDRRRDTTRGAQRLLRASERSRAVEGL